MKTKIGLLLAVVMVLSSVLAVSAAGMVPDDCDDYVNLGGFTICFLGKSDNGDGYSTWTYLVQSTGEFTEDDEDTTRRALSHWVLQICPSTYGVVDPGKGDTYTTFSGFGDFTGRDGVEYSVDIGTDPPTGISGIKFDDAGGQLGKDGVTESDIFQFTLPTQNIGIGEVEVGLKHQYAYTGTISGPQFQLGAGTSDGQSSFNSQVPVISNCESTNAVSFVSFQVSTPSFWNRLLSFFGFR